MAAGCITIDTMRKLKLVERGQDLLSCSENDQLLLSQFDKWAAKHGRKYCSKEEQEQNFQLFCRIKKLVDEDKSKNIGSGLLLNRFADRRAPSGSGLLCLVPPMDTLMRKPLVDCMGKNGEHSEKLNEVKGQGLLSCSENDQTMRIKFDKWSTKHGKKYSSEKVREETFRLFCRVKKLVDKPNSQNHGSRLALNMFKDRKAPRESGLCSVPPMDSLMSKPSVYCTGNYEEHSEELKEAKQGHDLLPCSENDQSLRIMFAEWAIKYGRKYSSEKEREKRFQIFCRSKKMVDDYNSRNHSCRLALNMFADRGAPLQPYRPSVPANKEHSEESKEALRVKFDNWVAKHGKAYRSEEERERRFVIFMDNRDCWMLPDCDKWLDFMYWEHPLDAGSLPRCKDGHK